MNKKYRNFLESITNSHPQYNINYESTIFLTNQFTYNSASKLFIADASSLSSINGNKLLSSINSSRLPKTFNMQSTKTHRILEFTFVRYIKDDTNEDIVAFEYKSGMYTAHILND